MEITKDEVINLFCGLFGVEKQDVGDIESAESFEDLQELIKDTAHERIEKIKKGAKDQAYKRAKREERNAVEKELAESLGIDKAPLTTMLEQIKENGPKEGDEGNNNDLTDKQVLDHPKVAELRKAYQQQIQELQGSYSELEKAREADKLDWQVSSTNKSLLMELGASLSEDPQIRKQQMTAFDLLFKHQYKTKLGEDGKPILVDKDGEPLVDKFFNPIPYEQAVKSSWTYGFKEKEKPSTKRHSHPNENDFNKTPVYNPNGDKQDSQFWYSKMQEAKKAGDQKAATEYKQKAIDAATNGG